MYSPKTKKELMQIINDILQKLHKEAMDDNELIANETITILGDKDVIFDYSSSVCETYNNKNDLWHCNVTEKQDNMYEFYVYQVSNSDDFCWQEEYHDGPL